MVLVLCVPACARARCHSTARCNKSLRTARPKNGIGEIDFSGGLIFQCNDFDFHKSLLRFCFFSRLFSRLRTFSFPYTRRIRRLRVRALLDGVLDQHEACFRRPERRHLIISSPCSSSTCTIFRFCVVMRLAPMWPAIFLHFEGAASDPGAGPRSIRANGAIPTRRATLRDRQNYGAS